MASSVAERTPTDVSERRVAHRRPAAQVPSITGVRLSPGGGDSALVNISITGALVRSTSRLLPGTPVTVLFEGTFSPSSIKSKVVRCVVADICKPAGLSYHIGIAFNERIHFDDEPAETAAQTSAPPAPDAGHILVNRW
jgi:hypothetical protein